MIVRDFYGFPQVYYPVDEPTRAKSFRFLDYQPHHTRDLQNYSQMLNPSDLFSKIKEVFPALKEVEVKELTKYVVGAKPNPPKKPRRSPKKGNVTPMNNVNAEDP